MIISNTMKHSKKPGRPTKYHPELGAKIASAMSTGLSLEAAAASCGVGPRTAFTWQNQHEDFRQAVEDGRARSLLFWERRAIAIAGGDSGNASIVALGLKNRSRAASGWHDAQRLEHSGPEGSPIAVASTALEVRSLSKEDRDALKRILLLRSPIFRIIQLCKSPFHTCTLPDQFRLVQRDFRGSVRGYWPINK
jgi:hypothetical protein